MAVRSLFISFLLRRPDGDPSTALRMTRARANEEASMHLRGWACVSVFEGSCEGPTPLRHPERSAQRAVERVSVGLAE